MNESFISTSRLLIYSVYDIYIVSITGPFSINYIERRTSCEEGVITVTVHTFPYLAGGGFDSSEAFIGRLSRVNIWSNMLKEEAITEMSKGCGLVSGDVVAWQHFKSSVSGDVQVETPSWCSVIGRVNTCLTLAYHPLDTCVVSLSTYPRHTCL